MSTILKALRRLEEDQPKRATATADASAREAPASADGEDPGAGTEGTDGLRDRILAEERANQPGDSTPAGAPSGATPSASDGAGDEPQGSTLRRFSPIAAAALVVFVLGAVVAPALFDGPESASDVATAGPNTPPEPSVAVAPPTQTPPEAPAPSAAPAPAPEDPTAVAAKPTPGPSASDARSPGRATAPRATPTDTVSRRAAPPAPLRPAPSETVAVAALPVAPPSRAQTSPRPESGRRPTDDRAASSAPAPAPAPPVELALVEPTRTPPSTAPPAPPRDLRNEAPSPKTAPSRTSAPRGTATPPRTPTSSNDRPVAKTADADPIERVTRPDVPDVTVLRTSWHPDETRRSARIRLEASEEVRTLKEGDAIGALVIKEISPSAVLFEAGEVEVRRRVGSGG